MLRTTPGLNRVKHANDSKYEDNLKCKDKFKETLKYDAKLKDDRLKYDGLKYEQYGQMSFLCTVHRNLCIVNDLCVLYTEMFALFLHNSEFLCGTKNKNSWKFQGLKIAFLKFHFLPDLIIENVAYI